MRRRVGAAGGLITGRCSTPCSGGLVVACRGGMSPRASARGRRSTTGIAAGQRTEPGNGSSTNCAATRTGPKVRNGPWPSTVRWCELISTLRGPATAHPATSTRRSWRHSSWTQGAGSNDKNRSTRPAREAIGRSRGGLTRKIHLAADRRACPISRVTTAGHRHDSLAFPAVMARIRIRRRGPGRPRTRPARVLGDKTSHAFNLSSRVGRCGQ
jgi:hypothetical protein